MSTDDDDLGGRVEVLEEVVAGLMQTLPPAPEASAPPVDAGAGGGGQAAAPVPGPWWWEGLDGVDRAALWEELRVFVAFLSRRYLSGVKTQLRVPMCWYRHSVAVEMLTALMVAHRSVYFDDTEPGSRLMEWHEWWLWPTLDRFHLLGIFSSCQQTHHDRRMYGDLAGTDVASFDAFVRGEVEAREAMAPDPSRQGSRL